MEEKKLTDEEIIAALECCHSDENVYLCSQCPLLGMSLGQCKDLLGRNALNLIYRLRGEVE
jgi:hypothetical protein